MQEPVNSRLPRLSLGEGGHAVADRPVPLFGVNIDPAAGNLELARRLARLADETGLDFAGVQDHPYLARFLDTWTLLAVLGATTERVRLLPNVLNLPLRPPAMLAKAAATLDVISGGRFELGLGAGANWDGIAAWGGPRRVPGEALAALEEAMRLVRAIWDAPDAPVSFDGQIYQVAGAQAGPAPAHRIGIWLGVAGPRALRLTGRLADGWIISSTYVPPEQVPPMQAAIDAAARRAGRAPGAIRRAYNLFGALGDGSGLRANRPGVLIGPVDWWVEQVAAFYRELRMDTFIFWPLGGEVEDQARRFAEEVVPAARARVAAGV
jgi:alkanesulfonate monooxygenase SsuD/methylene tetrahydromethanopterin reductase-like flavin-dependent oxidoreductase (luciferase family)